MVVYPPYYTASYGFESSTGTTTSFDDSDAVDAGRIVLEWWVKSVVCSSPSFFLNDIPTSPSLSENYS
jgi:hypothetical protein